MYSCFRSTHRVESVLEVLVKGVLEVVGEAKLSLGPLRRLAKSKTKEARQPWDCLGPQLFGICLGLDFRPPTFIFKNKK